MKFLFPLVFLAFANLSWAKICYVDSAAPAGGDGTSWAKAWQHPTQIGGVGAGDVVYISPGTYNFSGFWNVPDGAWTLTLDPARIGQVTFNASAGCDVILTGLNKTIFNFWIGNQMRLAFSGYPTQGYNILDDDSAGGWKILGFRSPTSRIARAYRAMNVEIGYFECGPLKLQGGPGWIVGIGSDKAEGFSKNKIHHGTFNLFYLNVPDQYGDNGDDGIQNIGNTDVYNCNFISKLTTGSAGANHQDGIQWGYAYVRIFNNYFENIANYAIFGEFYGGGRHAVIFNNIINYTDPILTKNPTCGIALGERHPVESSDLYVSNNLIRGGNRGIAIGGGYWHEPDHYVRTYVQNNVFYQGGGLSTYPGPGGVIVATNNVTVTNANAFVNVSPQGNTPGNSDFHYTANATSLINQGVNAPGSYPDAPPEIRADKDGVPRPFGPQWDIGPYEFGGTPAPTPVPTPTPTPTPPPVLPLMQGLTFNAWDMFVGAPFTEVEGSHIVQPGPGADTPAQGGLAAAKVTIPAAGNYKIEAVVSAANSGQDSFWIDFDAEPTDPAATWDVLPLTNGFEARTVNWRGNGPAGQPQFPVKEWQLSAGTHTLNIRAREGECQLRSIAIVQAGGQPTPTPTPLPSPTPTPPPQPTPTPTPGPTPTPPPGQIHWNDIQGKPATFPAAPHTHPIVPGQTGENQ